MVHANESMMAGSALADWLHPAFQPARIPLFALLVGYFIPQVPRPADHANLIRFVIVPFALVSAMHVGLNLWWDVRPVYVPLAAPYTLWFVLSVIVWRLVVPVLMRFRHPMTVAVLVSLASGVPASFSVLSLHRTLGLLPFVVLGVLLSRHDSWLRRRSRRSAALATTIVLLWLLGVTLTQYWGVYDGFVLGMWVEYGGGADRLPLSLLIRLGLLVAVGVTALAVLHLMPRSRVRWMTYIGAGGFTIYLLHGLVLRLMRHWDLLPTTPDHWWTVPALVVFAFGLAALLGSRPVRRLSAPVIRPRLDWLLVPDEPAPVAHPRATPAPTADAEESRER